MVPGGSWKLQSIFFFFFLTHLVCWDEVLGRRRYGDGGGGRGSARAFHGLFHDNGGTNTLKMVTDILNAQWTM